MVAKSACAQESKWCKRWRKCKNCLCSHKKLWVCIEGLLDKKWFRLFILAIAAGTAYCWFGDLLTNILERRFPVFGVSGEEQKTNEYMRKVLTPTAYSVLIFLVLWWFRTIDTRQTIYQTNLGTGLNMLASDAPIKIELAVLMLIRVSKSTTVFDEEISLAFIKRLKRSPQNSLKNRQRLKDGYRWAYAQYILQWLKERGKGWDLRYLDLRGQEFTGDSAKITYADIEKLHDDDRYGDDLSINFGGCRFTTLTDIASKEDAIKRFFGNDESLINKFAVQNRGFFKWLKSEANKSQPPTS